MASRVWGIGFRVQRLGFRVQGLVKEAARVPKQANIGGSWALTGANSGHESPKPATPNPRPKP